MVQASSHHVRLRAHGLGSALSTARSGRGLQVLILGDYLGFPHGMANSGRALLVARALRDAGVNVRVLSLQGIDRPPSVENTVVRGEHMGIPFEYACGTTIRHESFVVRRLVAARGWMHGALRLVQLRRQGLLDVILLWFWTPRPAVRLAFFVTLLRMLRVPVVREVNESPWSQKPDATLLERLWSPLAGTAGAVTISSELHTWAITQYRGRPDARVVDVPILVDVHEQEPGDYPSGDPLVAFAGSPVYRATIEFIISAMQEVWRTHPGCRLVITGSAPGDPRADWLRAEVRKAELRDRVDLAGYLTRPELLELYRRAHALLIPLFDDLQSRARFPTKIGEYLAAARPVVTNSVGEIPLYLTDGVDAVLCAPDDSCAFGRAVANLLSDPTRAELIGRRGRRLAESRFHYAAHGVPLARAFADVARGTRDQ
jgi:glycosyltransferase involved in cell wall biosynthesis